MQEENVDRIAIRLVDETINRVSGLADDPTSGRLWPKLLSVRRYIVSSNG